MKQSSITSENSVPSDFARDIVGKAGIADPVMEEKLLGAFTTVERSKFIIAGYLDRVNEDIRIPIGFSQSSLKPSTLARMIGLLGIEKGMRVLEVGAGSGYGSALMLSCGAEVFCIEQAGLLAQQTRKKLDAMGFAKILFKAGDGLKGWPELAPFDAIIVTFPASEPSRELLSQLKKDTGRLVGVFGEAGKVHLWLYDNSQSQPYQLEPFSD